MTKTVVFYSALDKYGNDELWETDGTQAGTFEITPGLVSSQLGINPLYITPFNDLALFEGVNSLGVRGLWESDGTKTGTHQITGIKGANPDGLQPSYLHVYQAKNEVLFRGEAGFSGAEVPGLWVTDGTAAGTFELGGKYNANIKNVFSGGLLPADPDFTSFNGIVLFNGRDTGNNVGLWRTNGTAAGTYEIAPIAGAFKVGTPGSDIQPHYMAVVGTKVIFDGADQQDTEGSLWVTDGTAAGTKEVGGQGNKGIAEAPAGDSMNPLPIGIVPDDITKFNKTKVLFAGFDNTKDSAGHYEHTDGLWVSNGTAAGTYEIGGKGNADIKDANPAKAGGIFWFGSIEYPDFTVFHNAVFSNEALFVGYDSHNHVGLWRTNGSAGGTVEIGGLGNAGIKGGLSLLDDHSPDFTAYKGKVLFYGIDGTGHSGLWITDGTAAGTHELKTPDFGSPNAPLGPNFKIVTLA